MYFLRKTRGSQPQIIIKVPGKALNPKLSIKVSKIKNETAKKKSPKPRDMKSTPHWVMILGTVGTEIKTGSIKLETCLAAETMVPVNKTNIISRTVKSATKISDVLHVQVQKIGKPYRGSA